MNQDFATLLRAQRRQRKLSQAELAQRAQISERTLRYWETGVTSPNRWELDSVLTALELTPQERAQALAMVSTPRGMQLSRQESPASLALPDSLAGTPVEQWGPLPILGDLLQAMRLRRGMTQTQVAVELRISRSTILRWETTETLPSEENRERLCALLGAYPEEKVALSSRRMQMWAGKAHLSRDECAERVEALDRQCGYPDSPLVDLSALALQRQLWLRATQAEETEEALLRLARVQIIHANWLRLHDRNVEARLGIQRSLNALDGRRASELFWQAAVNLAAQFASEERGGNAASVQLLRRWLPSFPQEMQTTLWCDTAVYAGRSHQHEAATAYLTRARDVLPYSPDIAGMSEHYYPLSRARILLSAGRAEEALKQLPPIPSDTAPVPARASYRLLWAEALLDAGENNAAHRYLDQLNGLFAQYPQPRLQRKLHQLARRL